MVRLHQKTAVRLFHGINLLTLWLMIGSGLQIYSANPVFGGRAGLPAPALLRLGGWLAGGRHWHFFCMWIFALNLLGYGIYLLVSGHWRHRYPSVKDFKALRYSTNSVRLNYAWHRFTLVLMVLTLLFSLYTGLGMYKPVQLSWIVASFGNDWQALRIAHFLPVVMITLLGWQHVSRMWRLGQGPLLQSIWVDTWRPSLKLTQTSPADDE